ncbi:MAG: hypothetical protein K6G54_01410 [Oscillospiraceae bacterium]|nr:hypothetical protein [Oscillospiraceae bacterium]
MDNNSVVASPEDEIDLVRLLFACLQRWKLFVGIGALGTIVALAFSMYYLTPLYESSISLYVNNRMNQDNTEAVTTSDMSASRSLVSTYITISKSDRVLSRVSEALDKEFSTTYLKSVVTAKQEGQTELFTVTVTTTDPERSSLIANAIADVFPEVLSEIVEGSSAKVIDYGKVPTGKSYPSNTKNALIGLLLGILLAGVIVLLQYVTDVRILDEEDLSNVCDYPLLGQIPDFSQIGKRGHGKKHYGYGAEMPEQNDAATGASKT